MKTLPNVTLELLATTTLINAQSKVWARDNLEYLKISLEITDKEKFIKTIHNLYDKKN